MRSGRWTIPLFVAGVLAVLGALSWVTFHALRLERLELDARTNAKQQETIRLVLWRMDSAVTPIIAREAARPYFEYQPFYPADRAYARPMLDEQYRKGGQAGKGGEAGELLVPSSLLTQSDPLIKIYFQREAGGDVTSPQVPTGRDETLAQSVYVTSYDVATSRHRLEELSDMLKGAAKDRFVQDRALALKSAAADAVTEQAQVAEAQSPNLPQAAPQQAQQLELSRNEYSARQQAAEYANKQVAQSRARGDVSPPQREAAGAKPLGDRDAETKAAAAPPAAPADTPEFAKEDDAAKDKKVVDGAFKSTEALRKLEG